MPILLLCLALSSAQPRPAAELKAKYLALAESWAKTVTFTPDERAAMESGRQWEALMMKGPDDPLGKKILAAGEPSFDSVAAWYPGKVLDRTVLGSYSDPAWPPAANDEFVIWWNGAISTDLIRGPITDRFGATGVVPAAHNTNVIFRVGPNAETYGSYGPAFSRIAYEDGYLPIVVSTYERGGIRYRQTALAAQAPAETAFVRFEMTNVSGGRQEAWLAVVVVVIDGKTRIAGRHRIPLAPNQTATVVYRIPPVRTGSAGEFEAVHARTRAFWRDLLSRAARIDVPEPRVNNAWRALLLQNFVLADGPRFTYGSGIRYNDSTYPQESNFGAQTFSMFGLKDYGSALQPYFVPMSVTEKGAGRKYQNRRAMPFHHLLENYRLTGRRDVFDRYKPDLYRIAEEIIADRRSTMTEPRPLHWGLLPPDKPGADIQASTQRVYVLGHNITNCQGLADFGLLLVRTGIDPERGRRYLEAAADFRRTLLAAMERAAIRVPGRPPFIDLQTLYFRQTPDYGPEPYDDLALGRLQGTYSHLWLDMQLHYNFFDPDDQVAAWMADYVRERNGFVLGLTRAAYRPDSPYGWVNNVYDGGYYNFRLRRGETAEFLLGFYAKLAYGMTRHVYVASEGSPFIGYNTRDGGFVSPDYSFPNSAANADFLLMLRNMLVLEELKGNVETGVLDLLRGAPRHWFEEGKRIEAERLATYFGDISFRVESRGREIRAEIHAPRHPLLKTLAVRFPAPLREVTVNGHPHRDFDARDGTVRLAAGLSEYTLVVR